MRVRGWLLLGLLVYPAVARAQTLTESDLLWGWRAKADSVTGDAYDVRGWLVLWPDHVWGFGGPIMPFAHGGGRWRLIGDTLWLAHTGGGEDFWRRTASLQAKGLGIGAPDTNIIITRGRFGKKGGADSAGSFRALPDSIFWSPGFRDTTKACVYNSDAMKCGVWVYKVTKQDPRTFSLVRLPRLSISPAATPPAMVMTRDSITNCVQPQDGDGRRLREYPPGETGLWGGGCSEDYQPSHKPEDYMSPGED